MSVANDLVNDLSGWKGLDLDNPAYEQLRQDQQAHIKEINADMRELFMDSDQGLRVLRILMDWTIKQPVANPRENSQMAYFREGQNDIVRSILAACHNSEVAK